MTRQTFLLPFLYSLVYVHTFILNACDHVEYLLMRFIPSKFASNARRRRNFTNDYFLHGALHRTSILTLSYLTRNWRLLFSNFCANVISMLRLEENFNELSLKLEILHIISKPESYLIGLICDFFWNFLIIC